jgi:hypothetical protein
MYGAPDQAGCEHPRAVGLVATQREKVSRMELSAIDFVPWGLDADWPSRRWIEPVYGGRDGVLRAIRLGHASDSAMVLSCTYPRAGFDGELDGASCDPVREIAFETTYAQVNLALHQITTPGTRPDGLISSLVRYASQQADRYCDWPKVHWGVEAASTTRLASWQSGFSLDYPDVYVIVHACGVGIDQLRLKSAGTDLPGYGLSEDPLDAGAMHWELWPSRPELGYDDLARTLVAH